MGQKLPQALWSSSLLSHRSPKRISKQGGDTDEEYGPEAAVWMSHDHWWQSSNEAEVGMGAGWLMSWH